MDPRHLQRIKTIQNLFALSFKSLKNNVPFPGDPKTKKILELRKEIDEKIYRFAKKYPLEKIAKTELAILRLSVYELAIERKLPEKVVIDEAIELAKDLSGDKSYAFINAILGKILDDEKKKHESI
ncbi:hypothetical protein HY214_03610 [Candidatus Roizmanbacteria bacterium]|nr:hypothetical protein [Candidatus Roizmanbacteria bacterium]